VASVEDISPVGLGTSARRVRDPVVKRAVICFMLAAIEGLIGGSIVFGVALLYHTIFLAIPIFEFEALFYASFSILTGIVYGAFSAIACARFLDGEQQLSSTLPDSFYGWTAAIATTLLVAFLLGQVGDLSRVSLTTGYLIGIPAIIGLRSYVQAVMADRIQKGELHFEKVSVVGNRVDVLNFLLNGDLWRNGHRLTATLYLEDAVDDEGVVKLDALAEFARRSIRLGSDHIVFVGDLSDINGFERVLGEMKRFALNVIYAPAAMHKTLKFLDVVPIGPNNALRFMRKPMSDTAVFLKRAFDLLGAGAGLILLSPMLLLVALAIILDGPGPVIYRQERRGFNGETFMIWKFRSMSVTESGLNMRQAQAGDARITRVGKFLRETSIDELPQLVNVLMGQMSIVGPRPHAISHDEELSKQMANYAHRQRIKPGITGWAQVNGYRGETSTAQQIEGRILHDIFYIDNWSIFLDLWTLALTFLSPAARQNAR
jgi:exopolysaccharide biosynthesis polyprenyl glycosylphosphotransferase